MKNVPAVTLAAASVPIVPDRAVVNTALAYYNYFVSPSGYEDPVIVWVSTAPNDAITGLVSDLTQCTVVQLSTVADAKAARLARRGKTSAASGPDAFKPGTEYHNRGVFLFFADALPSDDVQAVNELAVRKELAETIQPIGLCTPFRWYQAGIRTGEGRLPTRYVEFYSGVFFKVPFGAKSTDVVLMTTGDRLTNEVHDWYKIVMKIQYHHANVRVTNRYVNPYSGDHTAFVIQTPQFYDEYNSRWDSAAELQILSDLASSYENRTPDEVAALGQSISSVLGVKSTPHLVYAQLMTASFTEIKKTKQSRRIGRG